MYWVVYRINAINYVYNNIESATYFWFILCWRTQFFLPNLYFNFTDFGKGNNNISKDYLSFWVFLYLKRSCRSIFSQLTLSFLFPVFLLTFAARSDFFFPAACLSCLHKRLYSLSFIMFRYYRSWLPNLIELIYSKSCTEIVIYSNIFKNNNVQKVSLGN